MAGRGWTLGKTALAVYTAIFLLFLYGPFIVLTIISFQGGPEGVVRSSAQGPRLVLVRATLRSGSTFPYRSAGHRRLPLDIIRLALMTMVISTTLGTLTAGVPPSVQGVRVGVLHRAPGDHGAWHRWSWHQSGGERDRVDQKLVVNWLVRPRRLHLPFRVCRHVGDLQPLRQEASRRSRRTSAQTVNNVQEDHPAGNRAGILSAALFRVHPLLRRISRSVLAAGSTNTLPLELYGTFTVEIHPNIFAFGVLTTLFSFGILLVYALLLSAFTRRRKRATGIQEEIG